MNEREFDYKGWFFVWLSQNGLDSNGNFDEMSVKILNMLIKDGFIDRFTDKLSEILSHDEKSVYSHVHEVKKHMLLPIAETLSYISEVVNRRLSKDISIRPHREGIVRVDLNDTNTSLPYNALSEYDIRMEPVGVMVPGYHMMSCLYQLCRINGYKEVIIRKNVRETFDVSLTTTSWLDKQQGFGPRYFPQMGIKWFVREWAIKRGHHIFNSKEYSMIKVLRVIDLFYEFWVSHCIRSGYFSDYIKDVAIGYYDAFLMSYNTGRWNDGDVHISVGINKEGLDVRWVPTTFGNRLGVSYVPELRGRKELYSDHELEGYLSYLSERSGYFKAKIKAHPGYWESEIIYE